MNLRHLVRQALRASADPDPRAVARALAQKIDACDLRDALAQALEPLVVNEATHERRRGRGEPEQGEPEQGEPGASWRSGVAAREFVAGEWYWRAELTLDQVRWLAADCERRGQALLSRADEWSRLASTMELYGVARLGDLDDLGVAA